MSETSSDTNGDSTFEFLDGNGSKVPVIGAMPTQPEPATQQTISAQTVVLAEVPREQVVHLQSAAQSAPTPSTGKSTSNYPKLAMPTTSAIDMNAVEPTINISLQDQSPTSIAPDFPGGLFGWIANNQFINKVAEKAKTSVDTMITTLDPGMKEYIYSGGNINILVASDKEVKVSPIREAFQKVFGRATVNGLSAPTSGVAQPVGFQEGLRSAQQRVAVLRSNTNEVPQNQVIVSVENFVAELTPEKWYDVGCLVLDDPVLSINLTSFTQSTFIPNECVNQMKFETSNDYPERSRGFSVTIGDVASQKFQVSREDWHQELAGVSRRQIVYQAALSLAHLYKNRLPQ